MVQNLLIIKKNALGQALAAVSAISLTIFALTLNKSSLVIPGLRGTPAGIITICAPFNAYKFILLEDEMRKIKSMENNTYI